MKKVISRIANEFLQEAIASPRMLEDLAAMERYMAESYDGRAFVEMLQNADDAGAKRVEVFSCDGAVIFANDGRPFNEKDMVAICRSGMSSKERGAGIGYRGVGFKSATSISTEIIIYSAGAYFSFSKSLCARNLKMPENRVPTVRIPFPVEEEDISAPIRKVLADRVRRGYTTFFIFKDGKREKVASELESVDNGWLIFLNNVYELSISFEHINKSLTVSRSNARNGYTKVRLGNGSEQWLVITDAGVSLAFRFDGNDGIIPCAAETALFHCYLPTMDSLGFAFKANADFSTDPSRKHIILNDDLSAISFKKLAALALQFIKVAVTDEKYISSLELLCSHTGLSEAGATFERELFSLLAEEAWVPLTGGRRVCAREVKQVPDWIDGKSAKVINEKVPVLRSAEVDPFLRTNVGKINQLLASCGSRTYTLDDYIAVLSSVDAISKLDATFVGKLWGYSYREAHYSKEVFGNCYIPLEDDQIVKVSDTNSGKQLSEKFVKGICGVLRNDEILRLSNDIPALNCLGEELNAPNTTKKQRTPVATPRGKITLSKFKTPIQNCMASETLLGNQPKDVSKRNCGYDVESVSPNGETRYITSRKVKHLGDSFLLSDIEHDEALRLGEAYYVFVVGDDDPGTQHIYLQNPTRLEMEKRVKEWEWVCAKYDAVTPTRKQETELMIDSKFIKDFSLQYLNQVQRAFLNALVAGEDLALFALERRTSIKALVSQINSICDFYVGSPLLNVVGDCPEIEEKYLGSITYLLGNVK